MDFIFAMIMIVVGLIASDKFYANQEQQQLAQGEVKKNKVSESKVISIKDKLANRRKAPHLYH